MIRLDKFLCNMEVGSRSQVKEQIKKGQVMVDDTVVKNADLKIDETSARVTVNGREISYQKFFYYMLNKPSGVVSATQDNHDTTVLDLLKAAPGKELFPVGRLDKDTEGLLLITNDGALGHALLSPRKHIPKTYLVHTRCPVTEEMAKRLEQGVDIGEEKLTLPAKVEQLEEQVIHLTITEGKFHQVKRMLAAVDNEVLYLKRLSMGTLLLDESLALGEFRPLTKQELSGLRTGQTTERGDNYAF